MVALLTCCIAVGQANAAPPSTASVTPLANAHAHNDYEHARPLVDALEYGFCSVEADVYLEHGQLLVAHDRRNLKADRTLERLYLQPLAARVKANGGSVYKNGPRFWLLIDLKSEAEPTYKALHELLAKYEDILSTTRAGKYDQRAVTVVISGNRPIAYIKSQRERYAGIDGRLADLKSDEPARLMPMISDNWMLRFSWAGKGEMPVEQQKQLRSLVEQAHAKGRIVRFWATPEEPSLWRELRSAGVDLLNTDKLSTLRDFLLSNAE